MRALALTLAALAVLLALAAPAGAKRSHLPTKLWAEYPLVPKATGTAAPSTVEPVVPPAAAVAEPSPGAAGSTPWALWAAVSALVVLSVLVVGRAAHPLVSQLRERSPSVAEPTPRTPRAQYAPEQTAVVSEAEEEPRRYVIRRSGILRSCFVVVADEPDGELCRLASSRSFWRVGGERFRERAADRAWDELIEDLRVAGWEPYSARRSDFYVLLRRIEPEQRLSSILPTLEAYTHGPDHPQEI
jgi:hypothetical protein